MALIFKGNPLVSKQWDTFYRTVIESRAYLFAIIPFE